MSPCDILTTQPLQSAMQRFCNHTKPLLAMEPKMRIELTTYALRVLLQRNQVDTSGRWWTRNAVDTRFLRNWWKLEDGSGVTTELTTHSDIQLTCVLSAVIATCCCQSSMSTSVIYKPLAPSLFGQYGIVQP